jgi:hypothetical protein
MVLYMEDTMSKEQVRFMIKRTLKYGIYLGEQPEEEDRRFLMKLATFINKRKRHNAVLESDNRLLVESRYMDSLFFVDVEKNIVNFVPLTDENFFDAFMEVLEFITQTEKTVKKEKIKKQDINFDWV